MPKPNIYDNAKFEQISCMGLAHKYDSSPDNLVPMLNLIHLWCQNKVWYSTTFLSVYGQKIDLIKDFLGLRYSSHSTATG
jgi:hypothetical protein